MPTPPVTLQLFSRGAELREASQRARAAGQSIGFVPTMGALHAGHASLIDAARRQCDRVAVSIFVNPTQFAPHEDLARYPRPLEADLDLLRRHGCDWAFIPDVSEMYPHGIDGAVDPGEVARPFEGAIRPTHFRGVATVVLKLLQLAVADWAYFGRKDYQQTLVVQQVVADYCLPTEIVVCPIVRESDGLALSSRNAFLSPEQRRRATALRRSLAAAEAAYAAGERRAGELRREMLAVLTAAPLVEVDYAAIVADGTVREVERIDGPATALVAARLGPTRLIDNCRLLAP